MIPGHLVGSAMVVEDDDDESPLPCFQLSGCGHGHACEGQKFSCFFVFDEFVISNLKAVRANIFLKKLRPKMCSHGCTVRYVYLSGDSI